MSKFVLIDDTTEVTGILRTLHVWQTQYKYQHAQSNCLHLSGFFFFWFCFFCYIVLTYCCRLGLHIVIILELILSM